MIKRQILLTKAFLRGLISSKEYVKKMIELTEKLRVYNLKCEDKENIYEIKILALNIDNAIELSKEYLNKYKLYPIGIWEV